MRWRTACSGLCSGACSWLLALGSWLLAPGSWLSGSPYDSGGRVEDSPQGGPQGCGPVFRQGRMPCRKTPQPAREPGGPKARKARHPGCRSLWLLSLGQARESDPASGRRTEARGRRARWPRRDNRTSRLWMTSFAVVKRFLPSPPFRGCAGMTVKRKGPTPLQGSPVTATPQPTKRKPQGGPPSRRKTPSPPRNNRQKSESPRHPL